MDNVLLSAAEFHRNVVAYQDIALTKPVTGTKNGREGTVLLWTENDRVFALMRSYGGPETELIQVAESVR